MVYAEDLPAVIERYTIKHHFYAYDTQLSDDPPITSVAASISNIGHCIESVHTWCSSKRLQLNPTKTEIIGFGNRASLKSLQHTDISLHICTVAIRPTSVECDLGVLLDSELAMRQHIGNSRDYSILISDV